MALGEDILNSIDGNRAERNDSQDAFVMQNDEERKLAQKIERDVQKATGKVAAFRQEASTAEMAYDGHQWDELDKMRLEQLKRPTIVFNEIKPTINAISGIERLNRADIRFTSRPLDSDVQHDMEGDLASEAYAVVLDVCEGDAERSRAIKDMSVTGMGWYEIKMDYEIEPDGRVILERLPWREMLWDTSAKKENIGDSRWRARKRDMPRSEFKARWPKMVDMVDIGVPDYSERDVGKYELVTPYYSIANEKANPQVGAEQPTKNSIPVTQYQWVESVPVYRFVDPQAPGGIREMREKEWHKFEARLRLMSVPPPKAVRQKRAIHQQAYVARGVLLEEPTEMPGGFGLKCVTGEWDESKKVWYGVVRPLLDPQRTMNKSMSTALSMFLTNAKGGVMFETGAFADPEMAKNQWSRADAWIELSEGGAQKVVQRQPVNHRGAVDLFFNESKAAMNYVSGIPQDMLGIAMGDATAPAISKRVQAALSVLGWYFDNITRARRDEARTVLEYIREYWTQGQLIKVGGPTNAVAIPLLKENLPVAYDLALDESVRHNPNLKAQVWQDIQPMIPALLKFGLGRFLLHVLKYSPLPAQLVAELQKEAQAMNQDPNAQKPGQKGRGKQDDPNEVKARIAKLDAESQRALAQARQIDQESGFHIAELAVDVMHKQQELRQKDELQRHRQVSDLLKATRMYLGHPGPRNQVG